VPAPLSRYSGCSGVVDTVVLRSEGQMVWGWFWLVLGWFRGAVPSLL
jgi:hypothetical protein